MRSSSIRVSTDGDVGNIVIHSNTMYVSRAGVEPASLAAIGSKPIVFPSFTTSTEIRR